MTQKETYEAPTWNKLHKMLVNQAKRICASNFKTDVIMGVARGGVVPARILSDLLENSNFATILVKSRQANPYDGRELKLQLLPLLFERKNVLVVDDVADTGRSLALVKEYMSQEKAKETRIATLYKKPWSTVEPNYYEKITDRWIVFPWDLTEHLRRIMIKQGELAWGKISGLPEELTKCIYDKLKGETRCGRC